MSHKAFPAWFFHAIHGKRLVQDPTEQEALGDGWADSPAKIAATEPQVDDATTDDKPKSKRGAKP